MTASNEERFTEIDGYIAEMDDRLRHIAQSNAMLSEMVQVGVASQAESE